MKVEVSAIGNFLCIGMALQWGLVSVGCAAAGSLVLSRILSPQKSRPEWNIREPWPHFSFGVSAGRACPPG